MEREDTCDLVSCMPLMCIKLSPMSIIKITPYFDLALFMSAGVFQFIVFRHLHVPDFVTKSPDLAFALLGIPLLIEVILASQNIYAFKRHIRHRHAISFKLYDWIST